MISPSQKARMCHERAATARQQDENGLTIAKREQWRVIEQRWLRFARLYELMDEVLPIVDPSGREGETVEHHATGHQQPADVVPAHD